PGAASLPGEREFMASLRVDRFEAPPGAGKRRDAFPARPGLAEVDEGLPTADALDPDVLDAGAVRIEIRRGDDHQRGERLVSPVPLPVEAGVHDDGAVVGGRHLPGLGGCSGALEAGGGDDLGGVPADPFARLAPGERPLIDVAGAAEPASGVEEPGLRV